MNSGTKIARKRYDVNPYSGTKIVKIKIKAEFGTRPGRAIVYVIGLIRHGLRENAACGP